ncbi:pilus (MSHA type) biogenesis protein MshL [Colwellia psychrerythraea]|uniref:Pilus (MSHA type) biogenesis protein MshL n=2 Tax=Colwellia psychrerythraea TaxID=28229 RepID=A0A099KXD9_COLPS|nr:pilus (MSHA type) biogenesis protein MshL [Colwellia psychrerythraea]
MIKINPPMNKLKLKITLLTLMFSLIGCQSVPNDAVDIKEGLDTAIEENKSFDGPKPLTQIPNSVQQELMLNDMNLAKQGMLAEKRLEVSATEVEAKDFFQAIVRGSRYNVIIHPEVTGQISLSLNNVTLSEALTVVEDVYGYEIIRRGNVVKVFPPGIRTETIALNYLFLKRFGSSSTTINSGGVSENDPNSGNSSNNNNNSSNNNSGGNNNQNGNNGSNNQNSGINLYTENESNFWKELKESLVAFVGTGEGRSVIVSPQAGLVTVRALPQEITAVKNFITATESHLHRQVIIEAKIMEVTLSDDFQQGIKWNKVLDQVGSAEIVYSTTGNVVGNVISNTIGGVNTMAFSKQTNGSDFSGVIELLQTQGNVQVLSSPRITATNNQKAVIKVGEDEYFVTEVSSTTTTGTSTTTTPEVELTPFFSGIALDVTPQIGKDGSVILHVHPSVTLTEEQNKTIQIGSEQLILPLAQSSVRESDTIIRANSGEVVVIGGLIETYNIDMESKTPILGDIPYLGELFKNKSQKSQKRELVIMLKPVVVGQDTWKNQLQDARSLLTKWFPEEVEACELSDDGKLTQECQEQCSDDEYASEHLVCQAAEQNAASND